MCSQPADQADKFSPVQRKAFGHRLKQLREQAGLTQEQLAERCSIHWTHVSRLERGEQLMGLQILFRLARATGVKPHQVILFFEEAEQDAGQKAEAEGTTGG